MKRTKIIATLGPATNNEATLKTMLQAGVDVIRLNGSHYRSQEAIQDDIALVRSVSDAIQKNVAIFFDLQGPKIRVGTFENDGVILVTGQSFIISSDPTIVGTTHHCGLTTPDIIRDLNPGEPIYIDDGNIRLTIDDIQSGDAHCTVLQGGKISNHKGVNLPISNISVSAITDKDRQDVQTAIQNGVDYIALSFVSNADNVHELREMIHASPLPNIGIISKIERRSAVDNLTDIIEASDVIMVARGDLGVEVGLEQVPEIQKKTIRECNRYTTPVALHHQVPIESWLPMTRFL